MGNAGLRSESFAEVPAAPRVQSSFRNFNSQRRWLHAWLRRLRLPSSTCANYKRLNWGGRRGF
ncbi:hypothetical protein I79_022606 [Cricetulus griseus]|uniref:Uncharacterized protein n=1 Tax=Cricetulus griseus TaxID=10029 RepID=G3IFT3_CRIGR|nr:hypothetical protein I79_022606 [Cricetulus griseus]